MPGKGEVMEGAMQQAAQWGRQFMGRDYICASLSGPTWLATNNCHATKVIGHDLLAFALRLGYAVRAL